VDRYAGERRNAFPLTLDPARNQPVWVEVYVPRDAPPGDYSGAARITCHGVLAVTVPVRVTVWDFALPSTSSMKTSFGMSGSSILKQHRGRYTSDDDLFALTHLYAKAALLHRISTYGGSMAPPKYRMDGAQ